MIKMSVKNGKIIENLFRKVWNLSTISCMKRIFSIPYLLKPRWKGFRTSQIYKIKNIWNGTSFKIFFINSCQLENRTDSHKKHLAVIENMCPRTFKKSKLFRQTAFDTLHSSSRSACKYCLHWSVLDLQICLFWNIPFNLSIGLVLENRPCADQKTEILLNYSVC